MSKDLRQISMEGWSAQSVPGFIDLQTGSIMRIADAVEKMAEPYTRAIHDLEYYKKRSAAKDNTIAYLNRRIASLKGVITRMKKRDKKA